MNFYFAKTTDYYVIKDVINKANSMPLNIKLTIVM